MSKLSRAQAGDWKGQSTSGEKALGMAGESGAQTAQSEAETKITHSGQIMREP